MYIKLNKLAICCSHLVDLLMHSFKRTAIITFKSKGEKMQVESLFWLLLSKFLFITFKTFFPNGLEFALSNGGNRFFQFLPFYAEWSCDRRTILPGILSGSTVNGIYRWQKRHSCVFTIDFFGVQLTTGPSLSLAAKKKVLVLVDSSQLCFKNCCLLNFA